MNHYKKRKKTILFILIFESFCLAKKSQANLLESLQKYCVPKNGAGCEENVRATYDEDKGYCTCNSITKRYNSGDRACEDCVTGSYASKDYRSCEPIVCPAGYGAVLITDGKCPSGYGLKQVTNGGCPSGYGLKEYNPTTKKWN